MTLKTSRQLIKGFTLIEMLIALAIGAGIATMSYRALEGTIKADNKISAVTQQVNEVDRVWQYISKDLLYAVDRTWRDTGGTEKSALVGVFGDRLSQSDVVIANEDDYLLQFIRGNRENLLNQKRSDLYLVGYRLTQDEGSDEKILWRDHWSPVDGSGEPKMQQRRLLSGIRDLQFSYLPKKFNSLESSAWLTGWPNSRTGGATKELPAAVRVTVESASMGKIVRIFNLSVVGG